MADTDLTKVINLIMENPKLVEEIKSLATGEGKEPDRPAAAPEKEEVAEVFNEPSERAEAAATYPPPQRVGKRSKRTELLKALKPYVSDERGKAIESMISIADVLDMMREH